MTGTMTADVGTTTTTGTEIEADEAAEIGAVHGAVVLCGDGVRVMTITQALGLSGVE